ncbi:laccase [Thozetella sp. PMI_491]|nr:laccase [Thozetella sp. PMI_491]
MLVSLSSIALLLSAAAPRHVLGAPAAGEQAPHRYHRAATCHTPSNRACWTPGFNLYTDYESETPFTGVTRKYSIELTEHNNWVGPDGVTKEKVMLIDGKVMGPTIYADWGDTVEVTVKNSLECNGTSIHWHGIRQLYTNLADGANGITECPIAPGSTKVYTFVARQYGTGWYHSHFSAQYGNGVVGAIVIHGPASLPYDIDLGAFPITDYYYNTADNLVAYTVNNGPPLSDNVLFNGTNVHPVTGAGTYANVTLTPGKRHRLRIINTSVENHMQVSLVGHSMTVIATDYVPVNAYTTDTLSVAIGQRYDVTIDATNHPGNYWFNVTYSDSGFCGGSKNPHPAAVFHYKGAPGGLPTDVGVKPKDSECLDQLNFTPVVQRFVPVNSFNPVVDNTLPVTVDLGSLNGSTPYPTFVWKVNGSAIRVDWGKPIDQAILAGNTTFAGSQNVIPTGTRANQWGYWLITNDPDGLFAVPHPIHLHGHDMVVVGRSPDGSAKTPIPYVYNATVDKGRLTGINPLRRDVTMLPPRGWIVVAFRTDNPGSWLMHCHIAWHASGGLSVDFVERPEDFRKGVSPADRAALDRNCNAWRGYYPTSDQYQQQDSGI